ncbi:hypothetical protein N7520_002943 [Penicillium odoratum]|uniref:uncharacterized protein n=1 Tax=Penicillium odoratum TaxID=1167516 RepID=UPI002547A47C|nr:uncharacterized protein N7520_002943 [Penicillium odoratum]KAJ5772414.1 hypothetical protein N7520_002943 [Penicillium odoratum]
MRVSSIGRVLACVSLGAGIAYSSAIPIDMKEERSTESTDITPVDDLKINWAIVRGGLKVARDVIVVASGASSAIAAIVVWAKSDSAANSCAPKIGTGVSDNGGQKYNFKYWVTTTGKNCDTTAQTKTVAAAIDDSWDQVHKNNYDWACLDFGHGGTWHGHLAVATVGSGQDVNTMCN